MCPSQHERGNPNAPSNEGDGTMEREKGAVRAPPTTSKARRQGGKRKATGQSRAVSCRKSPTYCRTYGSCWDHIHPNGRVSMKRLKQVMCDCHRGCGLCCYLVAEVISWNKLLPSHGDEGRQKFPLMLPYLRGGCECNHYPSCYRYKYLDIDAYQTTLEDLKKLHQGCQGSDAVACALLGGYYEGKNAKLRMRLLMRGCRLGHLGACMYAVSDIISHSVPRTGPYKGSTVEKLACKQGYGKGYREGCIELADYWVKHKKKSKYGKALKYYLGECMEMPPEDRKIFGRSSDRDPNHAEKCCWAVAQCKKPAFLREHLMACRQLLHGPKRAPQFPAIPESVFKLGCPARPGAAGSARRPTIPPPPPDPPSR